MDTLKKVVDGIDTRVGDLATDVANVSAGVFSGSVLKALAAELLKYLIVDPAIATREFVFRHRFFHNRQII